MNIKNSLFWEWKNNFVFSDSDLFSVLRVLLLITVNMDHPVSPVLFPSLAAAHLSFLTCSLEPPGAQQPGYQ